jgi:hypothetical protein
MVFMACPEIRGLFCKEAGGCWNLPLLCVLPACGMMRMRKLIRSWMNTLYESEALKSGGMRNESADCP